MRRISTLIASLALVAFVSDAGALDNTRKGFMVGAGLGLASSNYSLDAVVIENMVPTTVEFANDQSFAFGIDFRMGWGINEQVMVFALSRIPWFDNPITSRGSSVTAGILALAATYSFRAEPGGPYVLGGLGLSSWANGFPAQNPDTWWGFGVIAGFGWEVKPHFPFELTVQWGKPTGEEFGFNTSANTVSVIGTIGIWLY